MSTYLLIPPAIAQEDGEAELKLDVQVESVGHNRWNDVHVRLQDPVDCGDLRAQDGVHILAEHAGAAKSDMFRMLLGGFLAGRKIELTVIKFAVGDKDYCGIQGVRLK